jgi:hypothetical protein
MLSGASGSSSSASGSSGGSGSGSSGNDSPPQDKDHAAAAATIPSAAIHPKLGGAQVGWSRMGPRSKTSIFAISGNPLLLPSSYAYVSQH